MREIKFRAFTAEGVMMEVGDLTMFSDGTYCVNEEIPIINAKLMQYTGLKTNGQEIYEGDIIENDSEWWEVVFDEGKFQCNPIRGGNVYIDLSELAGGDTWVQGNIYENPELLTPHGE